MRKKRWKDFCQMVKAIMAIMVFIAGAILATYFGLYVMFIKAIIAACAAFDAGTLTATVVGWTIIKCLLASTVAGIILATSGLITKWLCK